MSEKNYVNMGSILCYKTNQFLAFSKPAGLSVQSKDSAGLQQFANAYAKRALHLIHRIDQPVSGIVLFGRNAKAASAISRQFSEGKISRIYHAVVENKPEKDQDTLVHFLIAQKQGNKSVIAENAEETDAKECQLSYKYMASSDTYHLLEVTLVTGRHHQIRAQLAAAGMPIKGDVKYGARRANKDRSIHLHGSKLSFDHPVSKERVTIEAEWPDEVLWNHFREEVK